MGRLRKQQFRCRIKHLQEERFFANLDSLNQGITFTTEYENLGGTVLFKDCFIEHVPDEKIPTTVFRKPTKIGR